MSGKEYYNFVVLGAEASGKTCLCSCFARGLFVDQHVPTIDDEYKKTITYGTDVDLTIADLGGWHTDSLDQECLQRIKWAHGMVLVYDTTNPASFQLLSQIKAKVDEIKDAKPTDQFKFPTIVVGTKADIEESRAVTGSELKMWADEQGISYYTEVGLGKDVYAAKDVFFRLIGDLRAQEQTKKELNEAAKAQQPPTLEKRKSLLSPRSLLKRAQASKQTEEPASSTEPSNKSKEKEMKKEQKEKEKEMKKQLKEQKAKEKEEKERQKKEEKERQKAEREQQEQQLKEQQAQAAQLASQESEEKKNEDVTPAGEAAPEKNEQVAPAVVILAPPSGDGEPGSQPETSSAAAEAEAAPSEEATEGKPDPATVPQPAQEGDKEKEKEKQKERRKRRETIAALLSPRRISISGNSNSTVSRERSGSIVAESRQGTMSDEIDVVVSVQQGSQTMREKKKNRLTLKRLRRSEFFSTKPLSRTLSDDDDVGESAATTTATTPQVQFLRVTKPLDALSEYKILPAPSGSESPAVSSAPGTPVSHPHLAPVVSPSSPASRTSPRMRLPSFRNVPPPAKPLPTTPGTQIRPPIPRQPLPATPGGSASSQQTPTATPTSAEPVPASGAATCEFPNLEDLPIFHELFPPPTHLGPPPAPPAGSAGEAGGVC